MSSLVRSLGPVGDWLKSRGESSPTSEWRNAKRVWVEFTGTDLTVIDSRGTQDGAFPAPGVTSVEVAFKGSLGSLREVTVNYQCWTKAQLEQMSTAFMQLGRTVAVTFGWSINDLGERVSTGRLNTIGSALNDYEKNVREVAAANRGCVASYKGYVDNFTFSLNSDGGFDCVCKFITPAQAAMDVPMEIATPGPGCPQKGSDDTESEQKNTNAIQLVKSAMFPFTFEKLNNGRYRKSDEEDNSASEFMKVIELTARGASAAEVEAQLRVATGGYKANIFRVKLERELTDDDDAPWWSGIAAFFGNTAIDTDTYYFPWYWVERSLINSAIFPINEESTDSGLSNHSSGKPAPAYYLDSKDTVLKHDRTVFNSDILSVWAEGYQPGGTKFAPNTGNQLLDTILGSYENKFQYWEKPPLWNGHMTRLYVSHMLLLQCLRESEKLSDFMDKILSAINRAMGGQWDLQMVAHPEDSRRLMIIDANDMAPEQGLESTELNLFGVNSIARSVTLDTNIPNGIKAQLLYGANSDGTGQSDFEAAEFRFQPGVDQLTPTKMKQQTPICEGREGGTTKDDSASNLLDAISEFFGAITADTQQAVKASRNAVYPDLSKENNDGSAVLIPLQFSFETDGIEGIPYGALIQGNYIPAQYKEYCDFMVTGVGHSVSADGWTTKVETIMRRK